jgi:hypothetical protein
MHENMQAAVIHTGQNVFELDFWHDLPKMVMRRGNFIAATKQV